MWRVQSQVNGSSHFKLLGGAFAGTLLQSASVEVDGEAVDFDCEDAVPFWNNCASATKERGRGCGGNCKHIVNLTYSSDVTLLLTLSDQIFVQMLKH